MLASDSKLLSQINSEKMKKNQTNNICKRQVVFDGFMAFDELENGLHTADFHCCEDVQMEAFTVNCKVQVMRDGNVYITELPKRIRNKPIFRDDNCSLSLGQNGRYYFVFSLPEELVDELPQRLVRQTSEIARKVMKGIIFKY